MSDQPQPCPECANPESFHRRTFLRVAGGTAAAVALGAGAAPPLAARVDTPKPADKAVKPAEELIKELYAGMSDEQKQAVALGFSDPRRTRFYNSPINRRIG